MYLKPGTILHGTYRILSFINSGGFGCTYEAEHIKFGERVAIKEFFFKEYCNRDSNTGHITVGVTSKIPLVEKLKERFTAEAVSTRKLNHPNIVRVSDVFDANSTVYYVMEFIEGKSLKQIVEQRGPLSEVEARNYINQVGLALDYIHSKGILHLDIKPANIMIDSNGRAVVIDFGASKMFDSDSGGLTQTMFGHTNGYASPEQVNAEVGALKSTADIYSLGATLYNLLSGIVPPSAVSRMSKSLQPLPYRVDFSTLEAINASLSILPENRPQTVRDFLAILNRNTATEGGKQRPDSETTIIDNPTPTSAPAPVSTPTGTNFSGVFYVLGIISLIVFCSMYKHRFGVDTLLAGSTIIGCCNGAMYFLFAKDKTFAAFLHGVCVGIMLLLVGTWTAFYSYHTLQMDYPELIVGFFFYCAASLGLDWFLARRYS